MSYIYVKDGVSKSAIIEFLKREKEAAKTEIHAFSVIRKGELLCRVALDPYEIYDNKQLFSLSKSFCSTAVGFAVDEGLFKVTDRIVDIFPEDCPTVIDEKLSKMTVHNVLSMSTGHASCVMGIMINAENPVKAFLGKELTYEPGEKFVYNTGATLLLSIIVQKYTGKTVYDYLYEKLFRFLDHSPEKWDIIPSGYCEGGVGLYAEIRDIENLGKLYLGKGKIGDRRFLSEEWITAASSKQIDNSGNGTPDWCSGYGYQFWRNSKEGFRGDGAFGQLCFMLPSTETIISVQCECGDMQLEVDEVYKLSDSIEGEDTVSIEELTEFTSSFYAPKEVSVGDFTGFGKSYRLSDNGMGIKYIDFVNNGGDVSVNLTGCGRTQYIDAASGEYVINNVTLPSFKPTLTGLIPVRNEECIFATYIAECTGNKLSLYYRFKNAPHSGRIDFTVTDGELTVDFAPKTGGMMANSAKASGKEI